MNSNFELIAKSKLAARVALIACVLPISVSAEQAGKTIMSRGDVIASDSSTESQRPLKRRSPVYDVDVVNTGTSSQAQLRMQDGALIALKAQTQLKIDEYTLGSGDGGSVVMELISGGLRTITGEIKGDKSNYKLKTPVGSIGIRGTHYEVEWKNNELFLAVWDGTIELDMSNATGGEGPVLLGKGGDFSFAKVSESGTVTSLLKPPSELSSLSSTPSKSAQSTEADEQGSTIANVEITTAEQSTPLVTGSFSQIVQDVSQNEFINEQELDSIGTEPLEELIEQRSGTAAYSVIDRVDATSSLGAVSAIDMQMTVNFDRGTVEQGALSFQDSGGQWFAAFNGLINSQGMTLGVNFASHGNNLANGTIQSQFTQGLDKLTGSFNLQEIEDPSVFAQGAFILSQP
ncbi:MULTISPECIES: FecR family protein [Pseudoalteromonas]|uniref:FecR family protein n=1 Tax=Pseudoalteromonas obscura TaxID=3048491 RepID=A0ABT7EG57_9GAMM|nr:MULTISPECIES: FecR family protein [Pseudoalteromonas]MBQ4835873.1 FecR domain-containing protein [Pseudoalteromonas luteoviolacea]MDK2593882.1 FecR family protein [Pseudoalteromonas sp. P94(2023)]